MKRRNFLLSPAALLLLYFFPGKSEKDVETLTVDTTSMPITITGIPSNCKIIYTNGGSSIIELKGVGK